VIADELISEDLEVLCVQVRVAAAAIQRAALEGEGVQLTVIFADEDAVEDRARHVESAVRVAHLDSGLVESPGGEERAPSTRRLSTAGMRWNSGREMLSGRSLAPKPSQGWNTPIRALKYWSSPPNGPRRYALAMSKKFSDETVSSASAPNHFPKPPEAGQTEARSFATGGSGAVNGSPGLLLYANRGRRCNSIDATKRG